MNRQKQKQIIVLMDVQIETEIDNCFNRQKQRQITVLIDKQIERQNLDEKIRLESRQKLVCKFSKGLLTFFQVIPHLKIFSMIHISTLKSSTNINQYQNILKSSNCAFYIEKRQCLPHCYSDKNDKGTLMNL